MSSNAITPGDAQPENHYDLSPVEANQLYQGEVLVDVPILNMPKPESCWSLLRTRTGRRIHEALKEGGIGGLVQVLDSNKSKEQWYADGLGDYVMAILDKRPALVLSQTCDISQASKTRILVAPIREHARAGAALDLLKAGKIGAAFWLEPHPPQLQNDSYADLEQIQTVHKSYIKRITDDRHFRLKAARTRALQRHLTKYFGRPNSYDSREDKAPVKGTYMCTSCFYFDGHVSRQDCDEQGTLFTCGRCQGTSWILKGR